jgi:hypothetical protein
VSPKAEPAVRRLMLPVRRAKFPVRKEKLPVRMSVHERKPVKMDMKACRKVLATLTLFIFGLFIVVLSAN